MAGMRRQRPSPPGVPKQRSGARRAPRPAPCQGSALVVHPLPVVRLGLVSLLRAIGLARVGEASSVAEARAWLARHEFDVVLVAPELPDGWGLDCIRHPGRRGRRPAWIVVGASSAGPLIAEALQRGAAGFVDVASGTDELARVVAAASRGQLAFTPGQLAAAREAVGRHLSARERELARLLATGRSNEEIGAALGLRRRTIETYLSRLYERFGVGSRIELLNRLRADGLLAADAGPVAVVPRSASLPSSQRPGA